MKKTIRRYKAILTFILLCTVSIQAQKLTGITATASSGNANLAVDGNMSSRWESAHGMDPQWITLDLGTEYTISKVVIFWEAANAKDYTISISSDGNNWTLLQSFTNMAAGNRTDEIKNINTACRFIRIYGTLRNLTYGYSIWEIEIYRVAEPVLSNIIIIPSKTSTHINTPIKFTTIGLDQNNEPISFNLPVFWATNDSNAIIDSMGNFVAKTPGIYTITANCSIYVAQANIDVIPIESNIAPLAKAYASTGNATLAIDTNENTRWESAFSDPQWIMFDFGRIRRVFGYRIEWEAANAKNYIIEYSKDSISWDTLIVNTNMPEGNRIDYLYDLNRDCRYIKLTGTARNLGYGYSIWEFKIYETQKITPTVEWETPLPITYGTILDSTQLNAKSVIPGSFFYVPSHGALLPAGEHILRAYFTPDDDLTYTATSASVILKVQKATPHVTWNNPDTIIYGTQLSAAQLNATANVQGIFAYTPSAGHVLQSGSRVLSVMFYPTDTCNFLPVEKQIIVYVKKATPNIYPNQPIEIIYGNKLANIQLNANVPGLFKYSLPEDTVLPAGNYNFTVIFYPNDSLNYTKSEKSITLKVNKAIPVVTWEPPTSLFQGSPLTNIHLNATANIEGTFDYNPSYGAILPAGTNLLTVVFNPLDTNNYQQVIKTITINVVISDNIFLGLTESIKVYPNPFTNYIIIENNNKYNYAVIVNEEGKELYRIYMISEKTTILTTSLKKGIYFIIFTGKANKETIRMIKQ